MDAATGILQPGPIHEGGQLIRAGNPDHDWGGVGHGAKAFFSVEKGGFRSTAFGYIVKENEFPVTDRRAEDLYQASASVFTLESVLVGPVFRCSPAGKSRAVAPGPGDFLTLLLIGKCS